MSHKERVQFKKDFDAMMGRAKSAQNPPEKMCGEAIDDCVIDDKNKIESAVDPEGVEWVVYQCLYCKRAFILKS